MAGKGPQTTTDLVVVGAGVVGLGCALAAVRRGLKVVVVERDARANGASIRNFGFITVTGQQAGAMWRRARRTRDLWAEVADAARIPIRQTGLLVPVRRPEAAAVLEAFVQGEMGERCRLLDRAALADRAPELAGRELIAGLWSPHELRVESREAIPALTRWLEAQGVDFRWSTAAHAVETGRVHTSRGPIAAKAVAVCPGDDLVTLFPDRLADAQLLRCKLQMLRLADPGFPLSAPVMSDLGLVRYAGYAALPEAAALRARLEREQPEELAAGVHLITVQGAGGELVVGDSHDYGATPDPFGHAAVDRLILDEWSAVFGRPAPPVLERWTGTYAWSPHGPALIEAPLEGVALALVTTGAGASTGFAIGEEVVASLLGEGSPA